MTTDKKNCIWVFLFWTYIIHYVSTAVQQNITIIAEQNYVNNKILFYYHSYVYYRVVI